MHVLGLTPTSVLAGLFMFMGEQSLSVNPILYRTFHMLTPPSELPKLPKTVASYWPIHAYTLTQIVLTAGVFIVTLTVAGPAFPVIIILLVPVRLFVLNKIWNRETLRYVDSWACRDGTPEGTEDEKMMEKARLEHVHSTAYTDETRVPMDEENAIDAIGISHDNDVQLTVEHGMSEKR
ncbi:hypothetical protein AAFC00_004030 [Neodothiora populina]